MISQFTNNYQALYNWNLISFNHIHKCIFFVLKSLYLYICIEKQFKAEYIF